MKRLFAVMLTLVLLAGLTACGQPGQSGQSGQGGQTGQQDTGGAGQGKTVNVFTKKREWNWDRIKEAFEASHEGYTLNVEITEATDYYNLLKTYVTTGDLPDVIQTIPGSTIELWKEYLVDIGDLEAFGKSLNRGIQMFP